MRLSFFSTRAAHVGHVMPPMLSSTTLLVWCISPLHPLCKGGRRSVPDVQGERGRVDLAVHLEVEEHPVRPGAGRGRPEFHRATRESGLGVGVYVGQIELA